MTKIPCSVPILTFNSGRTLRRCLESVRDFSDVYIFDGNSMDDTLAIAHEFGVPVYKQYETDEKNIRIKNFTEIRNKSLGPAQCDWILFLDSDEYLSEPLTAEIASALNSIMTAKVAYEIQKKYVVKNREILYSYNYPYWALRLYNRRCGAAFATGKRNHEKLILPPDVNLTRLKNCFWSVLPDNYRTCVEKDKISVAMIKEDTLNPNRKKDTRLHALKIAGLYFLRAGNTIYRALQVYIRYGYKDSLPFGHIMRHVHNHLLMTWWRLQQVFLGK